MNTLASETGDLLIFKAISTFIIELGHLYEKEHIPLGLYKRLMTKTKVNHVKPIKKHIIAFQKWITNNKKALEFKDPDEIVDPIIKYSDSVYVDLKKIFEIAASDQDIKNTIWKHLITINMLLSGQQGVESKCDNEKEFISDIMKKVESNINIDTDPTQALQKMMSSGIFNELLGSMNSGINNGDLDINKLLGLTTGMLNSLQKNL